MSNKEIIDFLKNCSNKVLKSKKGFEIYINDIKIIYNTIKVVPYDNCWMVFYADNPRFVMDRKMGVIPESEKIVFEYQKNVKRKMEEYLKSINGF